MKHPLLLFCVFFLASCSAPATSSLPAGLSEQSQGRSSVPSVKFTHIFSFNGANGREPAATLLAVNGTLYGTTYAGGAYDEGTVFALAGSGSQTLLHSFKGGKDGALPLAGVTNVGSDFYGTTPNGGGPSGEGVIFKISSSGTETVLHHFGMPGDGANPYAPLTNLKGTLFGTTAGGGTNSAGTVFTVSAAGKTNVLYSFNPAKGDGATPVAGLLNVGGTLYGTTSYGGNYCGTVGCGTVFKITSGGSESVLTSFKGSGGDGATPSAPLVNVRGTLYGTTAAGGKYNNGTVFKVSTSGKKSIIYSFQGGNDGSIPQSLAVLNGTLYGTTQYGGSKNFGTVFSITTGGKESVLYAFTGGVDGATPRAGLLNTNGTLYGTTAAGGGKADGTVFSITP